MSDNKPGLALIVLILFVANIAWCQEIKKTEVLKHLTAIDTTMWRYLSASDRSQWTITTADSEKAVKTFFVTGARMFKEFTDCYNKIGKGKVKLEDEAPKLTRLLEQVTEEFEQGLKLNPFDNYLRTGITAVYSRLEQLYAYQKNEPDRVSILKNMLYLKNNPTDKIYLYNNLGRIYRNYELWEQARDNFGLAVTAIFEGNESAIDTTKLFENLYYRGEAQLRLYQDESALTSFTYARMIAPNKDWYNNLTGLIDFISWDGGNIRASEKYRDARNFFRERKYDEAEQAYLELLEIIKTDRARNDAQSGLSRIQFYYLDKKEAAIDRLWQVINRFSTAQIKGVAIDSTEQEFIEIYALMCLQMGIKYYSHDKKIAFTYFFKSSQIESSNRGRALLNLAVMSLDNPQLCLDYCSRAQKYYGQFNNEDKKNLYDTLYRAHLKKGEFEEAFKWFQKFHEI